MLGLWAWGDFGDVVQPSVISRAPGCSWRSRASVGAFRNMCWASGAAIAAPRGAASRLLDLKPEQEKNTQVQAGYDD